MATTSLDGYLIPFLSAGMAVFKRGKTEANCAKTRHHRETHANCTMVKVTGFGKALRMDFEDVFVSADVMYQTIQRA